MKSDHNVCISPNARGSIAVVPACQPSGMGIFIAENQAHSNSPCAWTKAVPCLNFCFHISFPTQWDNGQIAKQSG
jgi:hypothetical protein